MKALKSTLHKHRDIGNSRGYRDEVRPSKTDAESIQTSSIRMEISLWQEKTRWIEHLSGHNLIMMVRLVELREGSGVDDDLVHSTDLTYVQSKSICNISLWCYSGRVFFLLIKQLTGRSKNTGQSSII